MIRARRSASYRQSGASLVLVLVLVLVFGMLIPVMGQLGSASSVATHVVKGQRFDEQSAESAVQAAIAWARSTRAAGRGDVACPDFSADFPRDDGYSRSVVVECTGFAGSGQLQEGPNTPTYALQTVGTGTDEIGVDVTGGRFRTDGPLWSDSGTPGGAPATFTSSGLDNRNDLIGGVGPCATNNGAPVFGAPDRCNSGTVAGDPGGAGDPATGKWASSVQSIDDVPLRSIPADVCDRIPASRVWTLQPGFYFDGPGLEALTNAASPDFCGDVVLWLRPGPGNTVGRFSFDLSFFDAVDGSVWRMNTGAVVGGAPSGWDPAAGTSQVAAVRALIGGEGSCNQGRHGVELVFGDRSRVHVREPAKVELCGPFREETEPGQAIAVYGRKTGAATEVPLTAAPIAVGSTGPFTWPPTEPSAGPLQIADCRGNGACVAGGSITGTLTGRQARGEIAIAMPYQVPEDVRLDDFTFEVRHREAEAAPGDLEALTLTFTGLPAGYTCDTSNVVPSVGSWRSDRATCTASNAPTNAAPGADFTATLTATNAAGDAAVTAVELDHAKIDTIHTRPALRAQAGCLVVPETSDGCDGGRSRFLDINTVGEGAVSIWGTVYAPRARVAVNYRDQSSVRFARGAVLRSFVGQDFPTTPDVAAFSLPNQNSYADRFVSFEAFVNGDRAKPVLRARVYFCESLTPDGTWDSRCNEQPPQAPRITTWTVAR